MRLRYLVDTDWAIHWLHTNDPIQQRMDQLEEHGLGLSAVSLAELWEGVHYSRNPQQSEDGLHNFLRRVSFIGVDEETCKLFGKERGRLRAQGKLVADFDLMIGVTALQHDLTLLTNNRRHFENIEGLRIESLL
ncbi:MAG TPA: type II toxin-antitoxin system VapC family toxin [Terriglobia bacterium]|nr:type II toxin-antitoxin system VapC family toxin [Terriglobia bacterium]